MQSFPARFDTAEAAPARTRGEYPYLYLAGFKSPQKGTLARSARLKAHRLFLHGILFIAIQSYCYGWSLLPSCFSPEHSIGGSSGLS
jgi:hypothetical protein